MMGCPIRGKVTAWLSGASAHIREITCVRIVDSLNVLPCR